MSDPDFWSTKSITIRGETVQTHDLFYTGSGAIHSSRTWVQAAPKLKRMLVTYPQPQTTTTTSPNNHHNNNQ